jgi:hypothetical protein
MVFLLGLNESEKEYQDLINSDTFFSKNKKNILWINKVVNPKNNKKYNIYKKSLTCVTEVKNVYHGSNKDSYNNILQNGFNCLYNRTSAYGKGSYFAKNPDLSYNNFSKIDYEQNKYLIVVDICFEKIKLGTQNDISNEKNLCFTNSEYLPTIYVIPNDDAICLKYLICMNEEIANHW